MAVEPTTLETDLPPLHPGGQEPNPIIVPELRDLFVPTSRPGRLLAESAKRIEPFQRLLLTKQFDERAPDLEDIREALSLATSRRVEAIIPVRFDRPEGKPAWMTEQHYYDGVGHNIVSSIGDTFEHSPLRHIRRPAFLGNDTTYDRYTALLKSVLSRFSGCPAANLVSDGFQAVLNAYLRLLCAGRADRLTRIEPLLNLLPGCIPLGEMKDAPEQFVVAVFAPTADSSYPDGARPNWLDSKTTCPSVHK